MTAVISVILRCSPPFAASLEGWTREPCEPSFETPRKRAAPQDDGGMRGQNRHCEERSDEPIQFLLPDCFAEPAIGRAFARPVGSQ
jgi:hypothetical protein